MTNKKIIITTSGVLILLFGLFVTDNASFSLGGNALTQDRFTFAASSTAVTVGPAVQSILVLATNTNRTYARLTGDPAVDTWCQMNNDNKAFLNQGVRIGSSTQSFYEITSDKGNLYVGGIWCRSTSSSTMTVMEFKKTALPLGE